MLTVGELFAGIGGFGLGLERTGGFKVSWQVENDSFALKVLKKHWPEVRRHDDVCTFPPTAVDEWKVDVICAGFPCQDISVSGRNAGIKGDRSGLFFEVVRITKRLQPKYLLLENVAALLNRGMGEVLRALAEIGFDAEWHCLQAAAAGAPHRRNRVFILAYPTSSRLSRSGQPEQSQYPATVSEGETGLSINVRFKEFWSVEPDVGRVAYGVPRRLDRLRCLGNAVVPQLAQFLGEKIIKDNQKNGKNATH